MKTKFLTLVVLLATVSTAIIAQQYEKIIQIYKGGDVINSYVVSEIDSIKFDNVFLYEVGVVANNSTAGYVSINENTTYDRFKDGETITLKAVANSGYSFLNWTLNGNVVSTNNPYSVVVDGNATYLANFEEDKLQYCAPEGNMLNNRQLNSFTLTDGTNNMSVSNIQTSTHDAVYKDKTKSYLHTQPGNTLYFSNMDWIGNWMHAYVYIDYNKDGEFNTTSNPYGNNTGELVSYNFYPTGGNVGTDSKGNVVSNSCGVDANNIPSWTIPSNLESGEYRLRFKIDWESLDPCGSNDSKNSIQNNGGVICDVTLRVGSTDLLYDVTFKTTPTSGGTASVIDENFNKATLSATANAGYVFDSWKLNGLKISTDNPYIAIISADTEFEAYFREAETVTVSATATKGGSVEVSNSNPLEGTEVTLTATADAGFQFASWTLNGVEVSTDNPYTITARGNAEYVANFTDMYSQLTTVPTIYINTENGVGVTSKDDYVNAYVTVRGAENEEDNITEVLTEIKGRGNSTWGMAKKPYRLKFDKKIKFLGNEAKEKNWVLLANYADKTLMRNALAFETARNMMNFGFTPSVAFVDVVLNGENLGSYMLTDQVEVKSKRVPVTEQETTTTMSDPEITGGYLIEVDGFADSEISWFQTTKGMKVTIKYPKDDEINTDQSTYIANYTQNMENAMFGANFTDAELGWRQYIDESSMVDWYIACELFGNSDSWWSTYMYKERDDVFKFGPLWDFDIAFNNDNRLGDATNLMMRTYAHDPKTWIARWWQDAGFVSAVKARWAELRKAGVKEFMINYINNTEEYLQTSQQNNFNVWKILNTKVYYELAARGSYEAEVDFLRSYVNGRISYLDAQFELPQLYTITAKSANEVMGTAIVSPQNAFANDEVTLTATPAEGYEFVNWTVNGVEVSIENPYTATITANTEFVANFAKSDVNVNGVDLKENAFAIPAEQLGFDSQTQFSITFWVYFNEFNHLDDGTQLLNIRSADDGWPESDWGYLWSMVAKEGNIGEDGDKFEEGNLNFSYRIVSGAEGGHIPTPTYVKFEPQKWYHVAVVLGYSDLRTFDLYVNGKLIASEKASQSMIIWKSSNVIMIGGTAYRRAAVDGTIDEVRLYKKAITADEVKEAMQHENNVTDETLIGYWDFEGETTEVNNLYSIGYDKNLVAYMCNIQMITEGTNEYTSKPFVFTEGYLGEEYDLYVTATPSDKEKGTAEITANRVYAGEDVTLTATPAEGYEFLNWTVNGEVVSTEAIYQPTITEHTDYVANFEVLSGIISTESSSETIKVTVSNSEIKLFGTTAGEEITLFTASGVVIANSIAEDGITTIPTTTIGVVIVKVGETVLKVVK